MRGTLRKSGGHARHRHSAADSSYCRFALDRYPCGNWLDSFTGSFSSQTLRPELRRAATRRRCLDARKDAGCVLHAPL